MKILLTIFILFFAFSSYSDSLSDEIIKLKTNNVSDEVIIKYLELKLKIPPAKTNRLEKLERINKIDIESYEFFKKYYLIPRAARIKSIKP